MPLTTQILLPDGMPVFPLENVHTLKVKADYHEWRRTIENYFDSEGLSAVIANRKPTNDGSKQMNKRAMAAMTLTIQNSMLLNKIDHLDTAMEQLDELEVACVPERMMTPVALWDLLLSTRRENHTSVVGYFGAFQDIVSEFEKRGSRSTLSDLLIKLLFLQNLGPGYEQFRSTIGFAGNPLLDVSCHPDANLWDLYMAAERVETAAEVYASIALATKTPTNLRPGQRMIKVSQNRATIEVPYCSVCNMINHEASICRTDRPNSGSKRYRGS